MGLDDIAMDSNARLRPQGLIPDPRVQELRRQLDEARAEAQALGHLCDQWAASYGRLHQHASVLCDELEEERGCSRDAVEGCGMYTTCDSCTCSGFRADYPKEQP